MNHLIFDFVEGRKVDATGVPVKEFRVHLVNLNRVRSFIEEWHYSHNVNGLDSHYCFGLFYGREMIGAIIYGAMGMPNVWKAYVDKSTDILELRRLVCIDSTPKNTESYFIGKTLKWLKKNTDIKVVISYADKHYGHTGVIYRASNFDFLGMTENGRVIEYKGKRFHDKAIRTYHIRKSGVKKLKPFAIRLKEALNNGTARYVETPGKHIYLYRLKGRRV